MTTHKKNDSILVKTKVTNISKIDYQPIYAKKTNFAIKNKYIQVVDNNIVYRFYTASDFSYINVVVGGLDISDYTQKQLSDFALNTIRKYIDISSVKDMKLEIVVDNIECVFSFGVHCTWQ